MREIASNDLSYIEITIFSILIVVKMLILSILVDLLMLSSVYAKCTEQIHQNCWC